MSAVDLKSLPSKLVTVLGDFASRAIDSLSQTQAAQAMGEKAADVMLDIQRFIVSERQTAENILSIYRFGLQECREKARVAFNEGRIKATNVKSAGQAGAGRFSSYAEHLALLAWAVEHNPAVAEDSVAPTPQGTKFTMAQRKATLKKAFDRDVLHTSKQKVQMVELAGLEWDLKFVENLKEDEKALLGFTPSATVVKREIGAESKRLAHQQEIVWLRSRHYSSATSGWRRDLGLPLISGNDE